MTTNKKFSDLIIELTDTWLLWMQNNTISHDESISYADRRAAGELCETLINKEYEIVKNIDSFFEKNDEQTRN